MGTDSLNANTKTDDIYNGMAEDVETRFDISNNELDRPLAKTKIKKSNWTNKKWIGSKNNDRIWGIKSKNL